MKHSAIQIICAGLLAIVAGAPLTAQAGDIMLHKQLEYFPVENVRLDDSPFKAAQERDIEYLLALDPDRLLAPYYKEAGLTPEAENYPNWEDTGLDGHIGGHYVSALSFMYAATGNEAIGRRLQYMLDGMKKCQDASGDGYLCGVPGGRAMWADVAAGNIRPGGFSLNDKWVPLYNIHKTFAGLKDAYEQTHSEQAREMLVALADWMEGIVSGLSEEQIQAMLASEHGGLNEVFADVAVITDEPRYLQLAHKFSHKAILEPLIAGRNELTGKHANTQIPKVIGYKRIADIEQRADWNSGVERFWDDVVVNRSVSIGGNSVREHFHSPDDFSSMLESEQGPETCNTYNMLRLTKMLYEADMQPRFTDYAERAIFNHILSSENHEHGGFVYFTPMRSGHYRVYSQPQTSFWCCVGSGMENHARYGEYIYAHKGNDDIFVELFIPSTLNWDGRTLTQKTDFPRGDTTTFRVGGDKPGAFALNVRIPSWTDAGAVQLSVNGKKQQPTIADGYLRVERKWRKGDSVTVTLPMHLSVEQLPDKSANYSFLYGPVVLGADLGHDGQDGMFADDSRMGHVASGPILPLQDMPVITGSADSLLSYIELVDPAKLTFRLSHVYPEKYEGMELVPFASLNECRYMVYWPVISPDELHAKMKRTALRQAEMQALQQHTSDVVVCGEQQPESDHFIEMSNSWTGLAGDAHWRGAGPDGRFGYAMKKRGKSPNTLRIYYKAAPDNAATISADGKVIGTIEPAPRTGELLHADLPVEMAADEVRIAVAGKNFNTPEVYELRLMEM